MFVNRIHVLPPKLSQAPTHVCLAAADDDLLLLLLLMACC
jgi:hypothetical protein